MRSFFSSLVCGLFLSQLAPADVTVRSTMDVRTASFLPPAAAEAMNKQLGEMTSNGIVVRVKGKRSATTSGPILQITDLEKGTITLVDPKGKRFATTTVAEYGDKLKGAMPELPEMARKMLEGMKVDVKTDRTGKTATVKGIKTEELLVLMSIDIPTPMGTPMAMKMEMHMWAATKDELERVPSLKELAAYMTSQARGSDATSMASKMFNSLPGLADKLKGPMEEMMKASSQAVLRMQMKMIMPATAQAMGASDPNEPFTEMTTDLAELSTDSIPESAFLPPDGYTSVAIEELIKMMNPARSMPQQ
jgi:hypothetical protein